MTGSAENQPPEDLMVSAGLDIAAKWGEVLGPEKLELALKALEPQLKREHEARMRRLDDIRAREERQAAAADSEAKRVAAAEKVKAEIGLRDADRRRSHIYRMSGLISGVVLSLSLLISAVAVAPAQPWLAAALSGPSLLALAKIFVLRRSDPSDMQESGRIARRAAASADQLPPAP
ncbi:hypothetical protein [Kitasatospora sp. NPDC058190]|uniref:hypothetical protein n=1 Tax=Kitasatospora sp. NPDC058190 TaxID=3346371 RepID=UPI0036DBFBD1